MTVRVRFLDKYGEETDHVCQHMWSRYLSGNWTREPPKKPGLYTVSHRSGRIGGHIVYYKSEGKLKLAHMSHTEHLTGGLWNGWERPSEAWCFMGTRIFRSSIIFATMQRRPWRKAKRCG